MKHVNPFKHTTAEDYEHFLSYMWASGARHNALLCKAYFDGADAPHEEYEAYMAAHPEQAEQEPVAFVSDVYQSRYTLEWNGRFLPIGTSLYDHSLSLAVRQELEHKAEEAECVNLSLDKAGVPTADASGNVYSLWGRVCRYVEQAEHEPVAWMHKDGCVCSAYDKENMFGHEYFNIPLYTNPVRTKDLTPYEITALIRDGAAGGGWQGFAQRVIAADREKNK